MREGSSVWKRGRAELKSHLGGEQCFVLLAEPVAREEEDGDRSLGEVPRPAGWKRRPPGGPEGAFLSWQAGKGGRRMGKEGHPEGEGWEAGQPPSSWVSQVGGPGNP